jgi:hypothetical protein
MRERALAETHKRFDCSLQRCKEECLGRDVPDLQICRKGGLIGRDEKGRRKLMGGDDAHAHFV